MTPLIDAAEANDVRVVCVSTDAPESRRSCVVCVEPRLNGSMAGELMAKFVPPGGKAAIITGMLKTVDHRKKAEGFTQSFTKYCEDGSVVATIEGHEDPDESFRKTRKLLKRLPDLAWHLRQHRELSAGLPCSFSRRTREPSAADRDGPVPGDGSAIPGRHHRCVHASTPIPPRPTRGPHAGRAFAA